MKVSMIAKGLGVLGASVVLWGCPDPEPEGVADMAVNGADMGGGSDLGVGSDLGGGLDQGTPVVEPPKTLDEAIAQDRAALTELLCDTMFNCPPDDIGELFEIRLMFASREECTQHLTTELILEEDYAAQRRAVASGRASFDAARAKSCMESYRAAMSASCQDREAAFDSISSACIFYIKGTVPSGGACLDFYECAGEDSFCSGDDCTSTCQSYEKPCAEDEYYDEDTSRCVPRLMLGEVCQSRQCAEGLFCNDTVDERVCAPRNSVGVACNNSDACKEGLFCEDESSMCTAPKKLGEACTVSGLCEEGLYCEYDDGDNRGTCTAYPVYSTVEVTAGEPCMHANGTVFSLCAEGLYCANLLRDEDGDLSGTCSATPKAVGEACISDIECGPAMECDFITRKCVALYAQADGTACDDDDQCASFYCEEQTSMCASASSCTF